MPISGTPPLASLAVNSNWEYSTSLARLPCASARSNTALTTYTYQPPTASGTYQWVWRQWQSDVLKYAYNWTTADTISIVIGKCAETTNSGDAHLAYVVRVVSGNGVTIRGVIGLYHATSTEFPLVASAATRIHNARTNGATTFSSQVGDRIIVEIGLHLVTPAVENMQMRFGDPTANPPNDFALTAGLTTDLVPWVELSRTVEFGNPPLVIQDAAHAHTGESPGLVQHNILAVQDASNAHTAEPISLVQHNILAIAAATHGHTADNIVLTYHAPSAQLVIQDASHGHTADIPALTQHNILAIQDAAHGHTADGPVLTQHNILAIADAAHGHTAENISLIQHNILIIQDGAHTHQTDSPGLAQHNILSIADASHAHTAESLGITQHNVLSIADASHGHGADNVTLTAHDPSGMVLTIADASHGHTAESLGLSQHSVLSITDASHGHDADNIVLGMGIIAGRVMVTDTNSMAAAGSDDDYMLAAAMIDINNMAAAGSDDETMLAAAMDADWMTAAGGDSNHG